MRQDEDRRDRDLLVEIHTITKSLNDSFIKHMDQDREDFEKVHKRINKVNWYIAMGVGAVAAIEVFIGWFKK